MNVQFIVSGASGDRVYFYVQKSQDAPRTTTALTFEVERLNVGSAMNSKTGVFTAPVDGHYFFTFTCISNFGYDGDGGALRVQLLQDGVAVGTAAAREPLNTATMQSLLKLTKGTKLTLSLARSDPESPGLRDRPDKLETHFTGMLLP